ncbi:hypothetical protein BJV82DRAFT_523184 [Fennellomyces sp. T-0311]|nr:hypothetical protein BJV82DRAFT_523184 [Fennellomyces sp. T-0311]
MIVHILWSALLPLPYTDDILVCLRRPAELTVLLHLMDLYNRASNAKLNRDKTIAVSMPGKYDS